MRLWEPKPMPQGVRNGIFGATLTIAVVFMAINVPHVIEHLHQNGITDASQYFYATLPDLLLFLGAIILKYRPRFPTGWVMLVGGMAWLVWAALSVADPSSSARVLAVLPVVFVGVLGISLDFSKMDADPVAKPKAKKMPSPRPTAESPRTPEVLPATAPGTSPDPEVPATVVVEDIESTEQRTATDEDLDRIGRPIVEAGGGAPKVKAAIKSAGLRPGNSQRIADFVAAVKAELAENVVPLRSAAR